MMDSGVVSRRKGSKGEGQAGTVYVHCKILFSHLKSEERLTKHRKTETLHVQPSPPFAFSPFLNYFVLGGIFKVTIWLCSHIVMVF